MPPTSFESLPVLITASGPFAGSRAIKKFATNGLGPAFYDTANAEIAVRVSAATIQVNVFCLLEGRADLVERGMTKADLQTARRTALALAKATAGLDPSTAFSSKSLTTTPSERVPVLAPVDATRAAVFEIVHARVGQGATSETVLADLARGSDVAQASAAVELLRASEPGLPDWFWHPALEIPATAQEAAEALHRGDVERVSFRDDTISVARMQALHALFVDTTGAVRRTVVRALVGAAKKRDLLPAEVRTGFAATVLASLEREWDDIASEGDSYASQALMLAAPASVERCEALVDRCPKGWKTTLKKGLKKPV